MSSCSIPTTLLNEVLERDDWTCQYCGARAEDGGDITASLVIPSCDGGAVDPDNLTATCAECYEGKGDTRSPQHEHRSRVWSAVKRFCRHDLDIATVHLITISIADAFFARGHESELAALNAREWESFRSWFDALRLFATSHRPPEVH